MWVALLYLALLGYKFKNNIDMHSHLKAFAGVYCFGYLTYGHPNGFAYLQLGKDFINFFYLNIWHFKTSHRTTVLSFWIIDFINIIENFHFIHIQGR